MLSNWFNSVLLNPYKRQAPLVIHGTQAIGKSLLIEFLKGYYHPYPWVTVRNFAEFNAELNDVVICIADQRGPRIRYGKPHYQFPIPQELYENEYISVREKGRLIRAILNKTQWIVESDEPFVGCVNIGLAYAIQCTPEEAFERGVLSRARGTRLTEINVFQTLWEAR